MIHKCFWCDKPLYRKTRTREHIIPIGLGGPRRNYNVTFACFKCNHERGLLLGMLKTKPKRYKAKNRFDFLLNKWLSLEKDKLGFSPTCLVV